MKKLNQVGLSLLVVSGMLLGLSVTQSTAHARTYLRYYENIANQNATVTNRNATVYTSGSLKHRAGTMWNYHAKVEQYYAAHVTKNGKTSVYYKFRDGKRTGWVWHGYLKPIVSNTGATTSTTPASTKNPSTTASGKSIAPGTTVENEDWTALAKKAGVDDNQAYIMQLFSGTIYNQKVQNVANLSWNEADSADFDDSDQALQENSSRYGVNSTGIVAIRFTASTNKYHDYTAIKNAIEKAGYDASARAKFTGWSIGAEYEEPGSYSEGPKDGDGLILLVPNP
ncbi:hypothetical protein ACFP1H_04080 [Secundilactobacillus hailunensis]|uniref:D-alanyl-D-alanine carboxypeptidase n=1 Tax=Secundilactobacillus hailunensis TaxID=2559923 RepID=A0ABW1T6R7_9LACO|nr:hypothetical protein [Secundilactobacillus hailunensis]